jgi:conjugative relaxase-like TrwC/TraI family protein
VLTLAKMRAGQQQYYKDAVARGLDEYYTGAGELAGRWMGRGAHLLGLSGELDGDALDAILEGRHPLTGERLTTHDVQIVGYDATFNAPKSVSLLYTLAPPEIAAEVKAAHDAAVEAVLPLYERLTCRVRRGHEGKTVIEADGFVAAAYQHRSSRAGDPHLHTHVLIAHPAYTATDERWTALDGRQLLPWARPCGFLYLAKLRAELTRRLGVSWGPVRNGIADIAGVPRSVIDAFSQRRAEIEAHLHDHGRSSARAAQWAAYATRRPKDRETLPEDLFAEWRSRAADLGVTAATVTGWTGPGREPPSLTEPEIDELLARLGGASGLTKHRTTFDRKDVMCAVSEAFGQGADVERVLDVVDRFHGSDHVVELPVVGNCGSVLRRHDGRTEPLEADLVRFSTSELIALERRLVAEAKGRVGECIAAVSQTQIKLSLHGRDELSAEQRALVYAITTNGNGVGVVFGAAGTGKTTALGLARSTWEAAGLRVAGCALAARAAAQLRDGAGIESWTIEKLLLDTARDGGTLAADVLVVDECGMVGTRKLAPILDLARASGAKVVLVGDPHQLPEIHAGGAFAALGEELGALTLRENRRQVEQWERDALAALRNGDPEQAIEAYLAAGRVEVADNVADIHDVIVADWAAAKARSEDVLMVASRRAQVNALNRRVRLELIDAGLLSDTALAVGGRDFRVGDEVIAGKNDYRIGLLNGTRGNVTDVDLKQGSLTVLTNEGRSIEVRQRYLAAGHLTHGYATTVHKAQGATVDLSLLLIDDQSYREAAYTGLSRGRIANRVYVLSDDDDAIEAHGVRRERTDGVTRLREALARSAAQSMASRRIDRGRAR